MFCLSTLTLVLFGVSPTERQKSGTFFTFPEHAKVVTNMDGLRSLVGNVEEH